MPLIKDVLCVVLLFSAVWMAFYLGMRNEPMSKRIVRYDCRLVEFAPDIPNDVREECRRRSIEYYNQLRGK